MSQTKGEEENIEEEEDQKIAREDNKCSRLQSANSGSIVLELIQKRSF